MTTNALIGIGTIVAVSTDSGGSYTNLGDLNEISPPAASIASLDVTTMDSVNYTRVFKPGLIDPGPMTFGLNFIPASATMTILNSLKSNRTDALWRITMVDGTVWSFQGFITELSATIPVDGIMTASVTVQCNGTMSIS